jgi:hypothetical protein
MIENLVVPERPHGSGPVKVKPPKQPSKSITPSSSTTAGPTVSTGATLKGSLADLGNERFYADLLGGKAVGGRDLVISCEFEDVRALIDQKISDRFPMRFTQTASRSASLTVDERYSGERDDLERYVRAIQAVTVWNIELQFRDLLPEIEVKPDALTGEPTLRVASDGLPLLPMCVQERQPDSNIVECHAEFPLTTRRMLELVTAQINTWFVSLQGGSGSVNYGAKKFSELILRMGEELNFGGLECVPGPASITVNLECSPGLVDCEQIPLMVDLIEALSPLCSKRVVLNRIFKDEDIAQFCSQKFGDDFDWNIERRDSSVILTTSSPERVSKERVELFSKVFGLQFKFAPPPESLGAEEPVLVSGGAEELMLQHELAALLPPAVGRFAQFHMDGDRLTIFARTKNLPKAYIEKIVQDLVSIKCNSIEVSEDPHACGVKDPSLLSDIIVRTLPSDVYLRGVKRVEGKFVITLSNRSQGASITDNYKADLQACCDLPLEFNTQEFSQAIPRSSNG